MKIHAGAQEFGEAADRVIRSFDIRIHQRRNGIERIKQKCGCICCVKLLQLRLLYQLLSLRGAFPLVD